MNIRCFIAIPISPSARKSLSAIQNHLKTSGADVKWVKEDNLHITLRFLGERSPKKVQTVTDLLHDSFLRHVSFGIGIDHLGVFPNAKFPKVLWAGVRHNGEKITQMAAHIEEGLNRLGIPKERQEFIPHITLGRVRSGKNTKALVTTLEDYFFPSPVTSPLEQIIFYKSTLTSGGPVYEPITTVNFKKRDTGLNY